MLNLFKTKQKTKYFEWQEYKNKIDFLDQMNWQQSIRKQNIKHI